MIREYIFDIETTGLSLQEDKITEIGLVEMVNKALTGRYFHAYINPEKLQSREAQKITGLDDGFLAKQKVFSQIVYDLLKFLGDDEYYLVAHNAKFDYSFLNKELSFCSKYRVAESRVIDTLPIARSLFPNQKNSLDALCKRFNISLDKREYHGALVDSQLLAQVYLKLYYMTNQESISLGVKEIINENQKTCVLDSGVISYISEDEISAHLNMMKKIRT